MRVTAKSSLSTLSKRANAGDYAWDIAELLFYTGHYSRSQIPTRGLSMLVEAFAKGYLRKGHHTDLRQAAGVRYAKAFSFWTPAPIIIEILRVLRKASRAE